MRRATSRCRNPQSSFRPQWRAEEVVSEVVRFLVSLRPDKISALNDRKEVIEFKLPMDLARA